MNTFRTKYNNQLPGDMDKADAVAFGFPAGVNCDGISPGQRNGDGILQSGEAGPTPAYATVIIWVGGETAYFWTDLSSANMIGDQIPSNGAAPMNCQNFTVPLVNSFPNGKISGTSVYAYGYNGANWFGLSSAITVIPAFWFGSSPSIPVQFAYNIDQKIDDGQPTTGVVQAMYINYQGNGAINGVWGTKLAPSAITDSSTTCYNSATNTYSTNQNGGNNTNCGMSFKFQ